MLLLLLFIIHVAVDTLLEYLERMDAGSRSESKDMQYCGGCLLREEGVRFKLGPILVLSIEANYPTQVPDENSCAQAGDSKPSVNEIGLHKMGALS